MEVSRAAMLLRVFTREGAPSAGRPLFEDIVLRAREAGLAGATVLRGPMGFGRSAHVHSAGILDLSASLPLVIEIVDAEAPLRAFITTLQDLPGVALATLERIEVVVGEVRTAI
jgi:PII-like signaling protein